MGGNQENPRQSLKCFPLADSQFPTDESDDPETGKQEANKQNRKKHFQSTPDVSFERLFRSICSMLDLYCRPKIRFVTVGLIDLVPAVSSLIGCHKLSLWRKNPLELI